MAAEYSSSRPCSALPRSHSHAFFFSGTCFEFSKWIRLSFRVSVLWQVDWPILRLLWSEVLFGSPLGSFVVDVQNGGKTYNRGLICLNNQQGLYVSCSSLSVKHLVSSISSYDEASLHPCLVIGWSFYCVLYSAYLFRLYSWLFVLSKPYLCFLVSMVLPG